MKGICDRISIAYRTCKNNLNTMFDKAGFNKKERLMFWLCVICIVLGCTVSCVIIFGERLIWHLTEVCVITQILCGIVLYALTYKFAIWYGTRLSESARKRNGWKVHYGYHDFSEMEREIAELRIQNADFRRQLDLAYEQIAGLETLIRSEKK